MSHTRPRRGKVAFRASAGIGGSLMPGRLKFDKELTELLASRFPESFFKFRIAYSRSAHPPDARGLATACSY